MPRPAFCIVRTAPTFCPSTDALTGSTSKVVLYCETEAWARFEAGRLNDESYRACGDASFDVRDAAEPFRLRVRPFTAAVVAIDDEIPF